MGNITRRNDLIYAGAKFDYDKISVLQKNPNRNGKLGWKIRLE